MRVLRLPPKTRSLTKHYLALRLGPHKIRCPYFQNIVRRRVSPVFAGKGLPEEIEKETLKLLKQRKKLLSHLSSDNLQLYMVMGGLGVDCSGLVTNLLNSFLLEKGLGTLWENLSYPTLNPIRLFIYTVADGFFKLYEDENVNYNYEKSMFSVIPLNYSEKEHTLKIRKREGEFPGMLKTRTFEIIWIGKHKSAGLDFQMKPDRIITYNGTEILLKMD